MSDELNSRISPLYAAISVTERTDPSDFPAMVWKTDTEIGAFQDFTGGMSQHELANQAHQIINLVAHFRDHLKRWAGKNGRDTKLVDETFDGSLPLRVLMDLCDAEKHGGDPRNGGHSRLSPTLRDICRPMMLTATPGQPVTMLLNVATGETIIEGQRKTVIVGEIYSKAGDRISGLHEFIAQSVAALETLLRDFGIPSPG